MLDHWMHRNTTPKLTNRQLLAHCSDICKQKLVSQLEVDKVQQGYGKGEPGQQVRGEIAPALHSEIGLGYQARQA